MRLRPATEDDRTLLAEATLGNANWNGPRFTSRDVERIPQLRHYVDSWPGPEDFGLVAEDVGGTRVGVVWLKHFPSSDPGYGFVDPSIPELSIHVIEVHRGRGVGARLLAAAIDEARDRGLPAISLSVEEGNRARHLYTRFGFRPAGPDHDPGTLVLTFGAAKPGGQARRPPT